MEVADEIREEEKKDPFEDLDDIFYQLLNGKTMKEKIKTSRGEFTVKFPKEKDIERIGTIVAQRHMGIPAASFDVGTENSIYKCAVLDVMVEIGPAWFENAKKKIKGFSWRDMPDADFIDEVYALAYSFRQTAQGRFKTPDKEAAGRNEQEGVETSLDDGLFSEVASADG
jgi:hypothetical protein